MENKKNEELQSRREFFKKAAKAALPVVGAAILSSVPFVKTEAATGCYNYGCMRSCSGGCDDSCYGSCTGTCNATCQYGCRNACAQACSFGCSNTCSGWCSGMAKY